MASLESVFIKEFNRSIRMQNIHKNIYDVPLPDSVKSWNVSGSDVFAIKGISSSAGLYQGLNKTLAKKLPQGMVASKRRVDLVTRDFVKDENGRFVYDDIKVPNGSMVIVSGKQLELPYKYSCDEKGFSYIDFVENKGIREYMYCVPKKYLYKVNQTALALSVKNMKNFKGMGYQSWHYGVIFLHVIPYKPGVKYTGSKILKTGIGLGYSSDIVEIVDFWNKEGVIPYLPYCNTDTQGNLVTKPTETGYDEYIPVEELSLGDREIYGSSVESGEL